MEAGLVTFNIYFMEQLGLRSICFQSSLFPRDSHQLTSILEDLQTQCSWWYIGDICGDYCKLDGNECFTLVPAHFTFKLLVTIVWTIHFFPTQFNFNWTQLNNQDKTLITRQCLRNFVVLFWIYNGKEHNKNSCTYLNIPLHSKFAMRVRSNSFIFAPGMWL